MSLSDTNPNVLDLCRLCLGKDERLIPVFDNLHTNQVLCDKINVCLAIQISSEDRISQKICTSCYIKVDSFYEFRNTSSESQRVLERWLQNTENTLTDLNPQEANNIIKDGNSLFIDDVTSDEESDDRDSLSDGDNNLNPVETSESLQLIQENDELPSVSNDDLITLLPATNEDPGPSGLHSTDTVALIEENKAAKLKHNQNEKNTLKCDLCNRQFKSYEDLQRHKNKYSDHRQCEICGKKFSTTNKILKHRETHVRNHICDLCPYATKSSTNFKIHLMKHNKQYLAECEQCGKGFYHLSYYREHKATKHSNDIVVNKCSICEKAFHSKYYLSQHKKIHLPGYSKKSYQCEVCGATFLSWKGVKRHIKSIHEKKRYKCDICNKEVTSLQSLKSHKKIHSWEPKFVCQFCGKGFITKYNLKVHERVHSGEKPYKCDICEKSFSQQTTLKIHKRSHTGEKPYQCEYCNKRFITHTHMKKHEKVHLKPRNVFPCAS